VQDDRRFLLPSSGLIPPEFRKQGDFLTLAVARSLLSFTFGFDCAIISKRPSVGFTCSNRKEQIGSHFSPSQFRNTL
jgi:hypothetical protein